MFESVPSIPSVDWQQAYVFFNMTLADVSHFFEYNFRTILMWLGFFWLAYFVLGLLGRLIRWIDIKWIKRKPSKGKRLRMLKRDREKTVRHFIGDLVNDALDKAVGDGKLTSEEAHLWSTRIGKVCDVPDLLSKKVIVVKQQSLKSDIIARMKGTIHDPVRLPGDEPTRS